MSTSTTIGPRSPRPRDAATVVLVRDLNSSPAVLMGRRRTRDAWSDLYVFPGGKVDRSDHRGPTATELRPEVKARLELGASPSRSRALGIAAVRETFEETGLRIAAPAAESARNRGQGWQEFCATGQAPDLRALHLLCRAVTPPQRPKRFNARFFVVDANQCHIAQDSLQSNGELADLRWVPVSDVSQLPIPKITEVVFRVLKERVSGSLTTPRRTPLFQTRGSRHLQLLEP